MNKTPIFVAGRNLNAAQNYFNANYDKSKYVLRYVYDRAHLTGIKATVYILVGAKKELEQFCYENSHRITMRFV